MITTENQLKEYIVNEWGNCWGDFEMKKKEVLLKVREQLPIGANLDHDFTVDIRRDVANEIRVNILFHKSAIWGEGEMEIVI